MDCLVALRGSTAWVALSAYDWYIAGCRVFPTTVGELYDRQLVSSNAKTWENAVAMSGRYEMTVDWREPAVFPLQPSPSYLNTSLLYTSLLYTSLLYASLLYTILLYTL
ncbi:hypothetical protein E2C01_032752 [Portunus trituberculatus]|uniref:Uncharacterized protein n=1 Tax=Portunus trituberculatus TaxID=210409 RepID=A0A5B7F3Q6_PORTR|nr:hypothetical protein [Portunus trituberculatus]